jgi:hypothetical protein
MVIAFLDRNFCVSAATSPIVRVIVTQRRDSSRRFSLRAQLSAPRVRKFGCTREGPASARLQVNDAVIARSEFLSREAAAHQEFVSKMRSAHRRRSPPPLTARRRRSPLAAHRSPPLAAAAQRGKGAAGRSLTLLPRKSDRLGRTIERCSDALS